MFFRGCPFEIGLQLHEDMATTAFELQEFSSKTGAPIQGPAPAESAGLHHIHYVHVCPTWPLQCPNIARQSPPLCSLFQSSENGRELHKPPPLRVKMQKTSVELKPPDTSSLQLLCNFNHFEAHLALHWIQGTCGVCQKAWCSGEKHGLRLTCLWVNIAIPCCNSKLCEHHCCSPKRTLSDQSW